MELELISLFSKLELDIIKRFNQCLLDIRNFRDAAFNNLGYNQHQSSEICKCVAILKTGQNKGFECGRKTKPNSKYCGYHVSKVECISLSIPQSEISITNNLQSNTNQTIQKNMFSGDEDLNLRKGVSSNDKCDVETISSPTKLASETNMSPGHEPIIEESFSGSNELTLEENISQSQDQILEKSYSASDELTLEKDISSGQNQILEKSYSASDELTLGENSFSTHGPTLEKTFSSTYGPTLDENFYSSDESTLGKNIFSDEERLNSRATTMDHLDKVVTELGEMYYTSDGVISLVKDNIIPYSWNAIKDYYYGDNKR